MSFNATLLIDELKYNDEVINEQGNTGRTVSKEVFLVEDIRNNPGKIYMVTYGSEGRKLAKLACEILKKHGIICGITER